ncbi:MAG: hypothetical protein ACON4Y_04570 [Flavobacteriales bacterium]
MKNYFFLIAFLVTTSSLIAQQIPLTNFNQEVFKENFNSQNTLFDVKLTIDNYFIVDDGDLFLSRNNKNSEFTLFSKTSFNEENYKIKTSIKLEPNSNKMAFAGILLNTQLDGNGTVSVEINTKNEYRVRLIIDGQSKYLSGTRENKGWTTSQHLKGNNEFNYVDIVNYNGKIDLYFNFKFIETYVLDQFTNGRLGIIVGPSSQSRIDFIHVEKQGDYVSQKDFKQTNDKLLKLETDIIEKNRVIDSKKTAIDSITISNQKLSVQLKEIEEKLILSNNSNTELKSKLKNEKTTIEKNNKDLVDFKNLVFDYENDITQLNKKNKELKQSLETKSTKLSDLQNKLSNTTGKLSSKTVELTNLNSKINVLKKENEKLELELSNIKLQKTSLTSEKENLSSEKSELKRKIVSQDKEVKNLNNQLTLLNTKLNDVKNINSSSEKTINDLNSQIQNLKTEISGIKSELNKKIVSQKNSINSLTKQKDNLESNQKSLNSQLSEKNQKIKSLNDLKVSLQTSISKHEKSIISKDSKISKLETSTTNLKQKVEKIQNLNTRLSSENKSLSDSINVLTKSNSFLQTKSNELEELIIKYQSLQKENQDNIATLKNIKLENQTLQKTLELQKVIAAQFAESYRFELEKSRLFQSQLLTLQSEVSQNERTDSGQTYRVQLGLFENEIDIEGLNDITKIETQNKQFIYISGKFTNYSDAREHLLNVNNLGFKDAYIVKF